VRRQNFSGNILTSKWVTGHVTRAMDFLSANFHLAMQPMPSHSRLRVGYETDRRRRRISTLNVPALLGAAA